MSGDTEKGFFGKLLDKAKKSKAEADKKLQIQKEESKRRENLFQNDTNLIHASIDKTNRLWKSNGWIYSFDEVTQYDLIVDGENIVSGSVGLGRALVGGVLFGPVGALVGGFTKKRKSKNVVNDIYINVVIDSEFYGRRTAKIDFIYSKVKENSREYVSAISEAKEVLQIFDEVTNEPEANDGNSVADELIKLKSLLDNGVISQEEFEEMKKRLIE